MAERLRIGTGLTLLDGAALVIGAAVASVHLRGSAGEGLIQGGWVLFWITFAGVALTAAGPFLYLARRFGRHPEGYPGLGDRLWAVLGAPWVLTSALRACPEMDRLDLYTPALSLGIGLASLTTLVVVWKHWVAGPPKASDDDTSRAWTDRLGLVLSVAWPLQCGFGLVVTSP